DGVGADSLATVYIALRRGAFDVAGDTGDHPRDILGARGDVLVHEALQIHELASELGRSMQALPQLIRYQQQLSSPLRQAIDDGASATQATLDVGVREEVREPERDAVDHRDLTVQRQ